MNFTFSVIMQWFGNLAGRFLTDNGLKFIAYKALIFTMITVTFPAVAKNMLTWLFEGMLSIAGSVPGVDDIHSNVAQFSGFAGYLASQLMIADCISILLTAVVIRLTLNFVPFVG